MGIGLCVQVARTEVVNWPTNPPMCEDYGDALGLGQHPFGVSNIFMTKGHPRYYGLVRRPDVKDSSKWYT